MEAIVLAGGKAERLGEAAEGRPKALVSLDGSTLAAYQVAWFADAGVDRVVVSCAAGQEEAFARALEGIGPEIVTAPETEPLGRGGGLRNAAARLRQPDDVFALNGDELLDVDLPRMLEHHSETGAAATIAVTPMQSAFGVVDVDENDVVGGFREAPRLPFWVSCGLYVLGPEALAALPERGDHETSTFPDLAAAGRMRAFRHEGTWLTVNTPKDLRRAREFVAANPEWLQRARSPFSVDT